jgi:exodeoxyribonuclease VII large subunit
MSDLFSQPFEEEDYEAAAPRTRRVLTVSELTAGIRGVLETSFGDLWVEGEISNCKVWNTGHVYFTLKDESAQIRAVIFRSAVRYLRFKVEDGLHVIARGRLGVYDPKGDYQLVCEHLQPHGLGALQLAFDQLKSKLQAEGLFERERKRPLPALPRKIGIVTSLEGAALRDIVKVLGRRHPNAHLVIRPARVQGETAAEDIARGVQAIGRVPGVDVVIVARGGGSAEDLWAFNEERVARAIAACPRPVISAVGHEVDFTIADFVADLRAPTPSAAAEMVVAAKDDFCARIDRLAHRAATGAGASVLRRRTRLHGLSSRRGVAGFASRLAFRGRHVGELSTDLRRRAMALLRERERRLRTVVQRLEARDVRRRLAPIRRRLDAGDGRLRVAGSRTHDARARALASLAGRLETLSPLAVLGRGYAVCWNADRTAIVRSTAELSIGEDIRVTLQDGELTCGVHKIDGRVAHRKDE